jgi:hypothetical protein
MNAVWDDGVKASARCHQASKTGFTVVEWGHGVEDVGESCCADVQYSKAFFVGCGGVTERDDDVRIGFAEVADQGDRAGEFGCEGDEFYC